MSGVPIGDALAGLRGDAEQATAGAPLQAAFGTVEAFYPVEAEGDSSTPTADVRNKTSGGLETQCLILTESPGATAGLPEGTDVVIVRLGVLGWCIIAVRYTQDSPSPVVGPDEIRFRRGEMTLETTEDADGRDVWRMGFQPEDGADHEAAFIARSDGSIEGYSSANDGFCFKPDGTFYISGLGDTYAGLGDGTTAVEPQPTTVSATLEPGESVQYTFSGDILGFSSTGTPEDTVVTVDGTEVDETKYGPAGSDSDGSTTTDDGSAGDQGVIDPGASKVALVFGRYPELPDAVSATVNDNALPILSERGLPGAAAVVTEQLGPNDFESLRTLLYNGWEAISNTVTGGSLTAVTDDEARAELQDSASFLSTNGFAPASQSVLYPNGDVPAVATELSGNPYDRGFAVGGSNPPLEMDALAGENHQAVLDALSSASGSGGRGIVRYHAVTTETTLAGTEVSPTQLTEVADSVANDSGLKAVVPSVLTP